jgi:hypothetical protein
LGVEGEGGVTGSIAAFQTELLEKDWLLIAKDFKALADFTLLKTLAAGRPAQTDNIPSQITRVARQVDAGADCGTGAVEDNGFLRKIFAYAARPDNRTWWRPASSARFWSDPPDDSGSREYRRLRPRRADAKDRHVHCHPPPGRTDVAQQAVPHAAAERAGWRKCCARTTVRARHATLCSSTTATPMELKNFDAIGICGKKMLKKRKLNDNNSTICVVQA